MPKIISIDAGTTGIRALAIDAQTAEVEAVAYRELSVSYPKPGYVEQSADEILTLTIQCLTEINEKLDEAPLSVGITNQRETIICWDKSTGKPLCPAIVWQDRRTFEFCQNLKNQGYEDNIRQKTGLYIDPYFSASKINWLLNNSVTTTADTVFGTVDSWLIWNLTGGVDQGIFATEVSNASRTQLFNLKTLEWDSELCDIFEVPVESLPTVLASNSKFGNIVLPNLNHFNGVAISGVLGDQQSALFGQQCFNHGDTKATLGTGCFILINAGQNYVNPPEGLLLTLAWSLAEGNQSHGYGRSTYYALEGSVFSCASTINWAIESVGLFSSPQEISQRADTVADSNGVFLVPAFNGLGSPQWDPNARGTLIGMSRNTDRNHIARAILESIVYQTADILEIAAHNDIKIGVLKVDGGVSKSNTLLKILSDYTQIDLFRNQSPESTAIGAALMAGLGIQYYESLQAIQAIRRIGETINPGQKIDNIDQRLTLWKRAVERSLHWL